MSDRAESSDKRDSKRRFGARAQSYAAHRPAYPPAAIDAALRGLGDSKALTVADVGAGTGISSRLFAQRCAAVIAVEPNERMRAQAQPQQNIEWRDGSAQQTNLDDNHVDLVTICQAFHWFATPEAMLELARVARRRVALLQYERDERDPFTRAYGDVVRAYATDDTEALRARALEVFARFPNARVARHGAEFAQPLDREGLLGRAASSSYLPAEGERAGALRRDLNALFDRYARDGEVTMKMIAHVMTADLLPS
ncbi:MAG TPA: class I SAM-dependent methyltransferase [Candidatus Cybelea sp.]|jgi:SAM-dependent methyltransferase|nr:class I SAM-dependent methyltransferase [Candidatus Cybelea sp.]